MSERESGVGGWGGELDKEGERQNDGGGGTGIE